MPTVNVRQFDGTDDVIRASSPAHFVTYTWVAVCKRANGTEFHSAMSIGGAGADDPAVVMTFEDAGDFQARHGGGASTQSSYAWETTNLLLVAVTRTDGSAPRYHVLEPDVSGTMQHLTEVGGTADDPADWTTEPDDEIRFGNWNESFNFFEGVMVVQALWVGTDLSTNGSTNAAVAALAGGGRDDWAAAGADHLWEFDQASTATAVTDYVGSCDQISITGTSVTTLDVPTTVYQFASGPSAVGRMRSRPLIRV